MNSNFELISNFAVIFLSLFSVIYSFGIVWRVEKKLDTSFKLFLTAIVFFTLSEIVSLLPFELSRSIEVIAKTIFAIFFLAGTLEMRSMLRHMDGELKK